MVVLVHPIDPTIKRLRRLLRKIESAVDSIKVEVHPGDDKKQKALNTIKKCNKNELIVFLGHGRSDALFGSKGKCWNAIVSELEKLQDPNKFYNDEKFIGSDSMHLLQGKLLFCFACNSVQLAELLVDNGTVSVLGFNRLPTTFEEFEDDWNMKVSRHMLAAMKGCLNTAVKQCIIKSVTENCEFGEIEEIMKFELQKQITYLLMSKARYRYQLANVLASIKADVKVVGNRTIKIQADESNRG